MPDLSIMLHTLNSLHDKVPITRKPALLLEAPDSLRHQEEQYMRDIDHLWTVLNRRLNKKTLDILNLPIKKPINANNFLQMKKKILSILNCFIPQVSTGAKKTVQKCNNSDELLELFTSDNLCQQLGRQATRFVKSQIPKDYISTKNFIQACNSSIMEVVLNFQMALTKPSTKPKVIKIEDDVYKMGVDNVAFSDDLEMAETIKKGLLALRKDDMPMPKSILITDLLPENYGGYSIPTFNQNKAKIENNFFISTTNIHRREQLICSNTKRMFEQIKSFLFANGESDDAIKEILDETSEGFRFNGELKEKSYTFFHEYGHSFVKISGLTDEETKLAKSLTLYTATTDGYAIEFVPEMFALMMTGRRDFSQAQLNLYKKLGGIIPKSIQGKLEIN